MNWQTKEVQDWLDEVGVLNSQREDITKLRELVESQLIIKGNLNCTSRIKNLAVILLLKHVQWEQLLYYDYVVKGDAT